jgi:hypothetical protein
LPFGRPVQRGARAALCVAALVAASVVQARAAVGTNEGDARLELTGGDITVLCRLGCERTAARVLEVATARGAAVAASAGLEHLGPVRVFVASGDDEFAALTYGGVPDWGAGCAFPGRGVVVLRDPLSAPDPLGMEDVIAHELAHIAVGRVLGDRPVPRWFHEGIAMTLAGEWRLPRSSMLSSAGAGGKLIPLGEIAASFPASASEAMLSYSESFYAVRFLMDEAGSATPAHVLHVIAAAPTFEDGITSLTGRTLIEFERDVVASFRRRFGWGMLLTRWNVVFALLAILLVVGGTARIARARRTMREWEAKESARPAVRRAQRNGSGSSWN